MYKFAGCVFWSLVILIGGGIVLGIIALLILFILGLFL